MRYYETRFEDYVKSIQKHNIHPELQHIFKRFPDKITDLNNMIFYGPPGTGKYSQVLYSIQKYSPTNLKYERKININLQKKTHYSFQISDIHFEIDMSLLGCNARIVWNEIYHHILDILSTRTGHSGIIVCKNFHCIHSELLDVFYSYMENLSYMNIKLKYVLISEQISFLPNNILNSSLIIPVSRPTKTNYNAIVQNKIKKNNELSKINNIKNLHSNIKQLSNSQEILSNKIITKLVQYKELNFMLLRDDLYNLFIYQLDINKCILHILKHFILTKQLNRENIVYIFNKIVPFLKYFNNNYRPIYHLESFILSICKTIHEL